jgi:hypothetical protein
MPQETVATSCEGVRCRVSSASERACPVCGGDLIATRSEWRCMRCAFVLCEDCDGGVRDLSLREE